MNKQEHILRKRAIYTGLHPFLNEKQLMQALLIWEGKYANSTGFSMRYYVADLMNEIQPSCDAKNILVNLVSSLVKLDADLLPDPSNALEVFKRFNRINFDAHFSIPILEAFQLFILKWFKQVDTNTAADIVADVLEDIRDLDISSVLKAKLSDWLNKRIDRMRLPYVDDSDLRRLVNAFYIAFCEHCGPVKADATLSQAITALRNNGGAAYTELFKKIL